jgi:hypothetical protein
LLPVVTTTAAFVSRLWALRSVIPVVKDSASSSQIAAIVVTWGRPSGRTVASQ